jgi:hypothetical protein
MLGLTYIPLFQNNTPPRFMLCSVIYLFSDPIGLFTVLFSALQVPPD